MRIFNVKDEERKPPKPLRKLYYHQSGIQSMAFSADGQYLVTVGTYKDQLLAIWHVGRGQMEKNGYADLGNKVINSVKVDPFAEDVELRFVTVGNNESCTVWEYLQVEAEDEEQEGELMLK
jgi:WD40 repeat protein